MENMGLASLFVITLEKRSFEKNDINMKISLHIKFAYDIYGSS